MNISEKAHNKSPLIESSMHEKSTSFRENSVIMEREVLVDERKKVTTNPAHIKYFQLNDDSVVSDMQGKNASVCEDSVILEPEVQKNGRKNVTQKTASNKRKLHPDDDSDLISIYEDSVIVEPETRKSKRQKTTAKRAPLKRKLRPDDERTLKILADKFRTDQGLAVCQVPECSTKPMKSTKPSNLKRHLYAVHPTVYANLFPHEVSAQKHSELEAFNAVQDAIELVTINGYPFAMLNSSGMRGFINSRLQAIRPNGFAVTINRFNISKRVAEESNLIRNYITNELKNKTISIMFNICRKASLSVLGLHATYMKGETVICRSLGTVQIEERHTAVFFSKYGARYSW